MRHDTRTNLGSCDHGTLGTLQRGAWLAAFLLFVVLGASAQPVHELSDEEVTAERLIELLKADESPPGARGLQARGAGGTDDCAELKEQSSRGITVEPVVEPVSKTVSVRLLFPFDSAEITPETAAKLDEIGKALSSRALGRGCFELEGHTDSVGSEPYNEALSLRRARSVADYLIEHFDIDQDRLLLEGHGESEPIADNDTERGRQRNRRVQLTQVRGAG